jgi:hypothetical protein
VARIDPKFASRVNAELWLAHDYGKVYAVETTTDGGKRLCIAVSSDGSQVLRTLWRCLEEPLLLLYVLAVFRGGGPVGRYQSDELSHEELDALFARHGEFWDNDGRHSIWLRSERDDATLVYDRHNLIYAYGAFERFELILEALGYAATAEVSLSFEHQHRYYADFDGLEQELTTRLVNGRSDLHPGDENPC